MRLVQQLEGDIARRVGEPGRDLRPKGRQPDPTGGSVLRAGVEVMPVNDDAEPGLLGVGDDLVELGEPGRIEPVLRVHVAKRLEVQPDKIEAAAADLSEVAPLKAAL